jgi:hypothetical protein
LEPREVVIGLKRGPDYSTLHKAAQRILLKGRRRKHSYTQRAQVETSNSMIK